MSVNRVINVCVCQSVKRVYYEPTANNELFNKRNEDRERQLRKQYTLNEFTSTSSLMHFGHIIAIKL